MYSDGYRFTHVRKYKYIYNRFNDRIKNIKRKGTQLGSFLFTYYLSYKVELYVHLFFEQVLHQIDRILKLLLVLQEPLME